MNSAEDEVRVREIKRLLDRIQQLPLVPPPEPAANAGYQEWAPEPQFQTAGEGYAPVAAVKPASSLSPWVFVLATALNTIVVAVLAVVITLGVVRQEPVASAASLTTTRTSPSSDPRDPISTSSVFTARALPSTRMVELAPIGSQAEPLRLEPRKPARLPLLLEPEDAAQESFILVLSHLPAGAELTGGRRIGSDSWLLPPNSISRLELSLAEWSTSLLEVGVELRRIDGSVAARSRAWIMVPPPDVPRAARLDQTALKDMLQKGDQLLGRGDVVGARAVYERAAEMGSGPAALALGSTFDPNRLWSLGVFGMVGNKERARHGTRGPIRWAIRVPRTG